MENAAYWAEQVALAERIARREHEGQVDKNGEPYWKHPAAVAARLEGFPIRQAAAWLHDVPEDTPMTLEGLRAEGVDWAVLAIVEAMTHAKGQPRESYYANLVATGPDAVAVKEADILENERPDRHVLLDPATSERLLAKYAKARRCLGLPPREEEKR